MDKSKYAKRLRELGCVRLHEGYGEDDLRKIAEQGASNDPLPEEDLDALLAAGSIPSFLEYPAGSSRVHIVDEYGIQWEGSATIVPNLKSELGFSDLEERQAARFLY